MAGRPLISYFIQFCWFIWWYIFIYIYICICTYLYIQCPARITRHLAIFCFHLHCFLWWSAETEEPSTCKHSFDNNDWTTYLTQRHRQQKCGWISGLTHLLRSNNVYIFVYRQHFLYFGILPAVIFAVNFTWYPCVLVPLVYRSTGFNWTQRYQAMFTANITAGNITNKWQQRCAISFFICIVTVIFSNLFQDLLSKNIENKSATNQPAVMFAVNVTWYRCVQRYPVARYTNGTRTQGCQVMFTAKTTANHIPKYKRPI